ncbi:hypothetical protein BX600DRAFT_443585 [Xylariales sp. PMI_506]|nr:hypothetical protein BX600DRAFT_443585 [Xylariales sp. PMI_506]
MPVRRAACEPCRRAKAACGHEKPVCARCRDRGQAYCVYRARPFKRKSTNKNVPNLRTIRSDSLVNILEPEQRVNPNTYVATPATATESATRHRYPNPGFLGPYSQSGILEQVSAYATADSAATSGANTPGPISSLSTASVDLLKDRDILDRAVHCVKRLFQLQISHLCQLVRTWLERGVSLSIAEPLVPACNDAVLFLGSLSQVRSRQRRSTVAAVSDDSNIEGSCNEGHHNVDDDDDGDDGYFDDEAALGKRPSLPRRTARTLLENTTKKVLIHSHSTPGEFLDQIVGENLRWETVGLFLVAASRAVLDTASFAALYGNEEQRRSLVRTLMYICDGCLEICLALDCLSDLQLVLQYENFVVHTHVDGDQSFQSWRRMGDLTTSLYTLGYHEKIDADASNIPIFIAELRKACFARVYAADKNVAIFLGRPPRVAKEYCYFQIPSNLPNAWADRADYDTNSLGASPQALSEANRSIDRYIFADDEVINYTADTRCCAIFAAFKEETLHFFRRRPAHKDADQIWEIRQRIQEQWDDLPSHFKLTTNLRDCHSDPFVRDFLATTRLDYLHTLLLLNLSTEPSIRELTEPTLHIAAEMLSLTVQVIILSEHLVTSGTSLHWKVAHYGLPAAGIASMALLASHAFFHGDNTSLSFGKLVQDLNVLVVEIRLGAWIQTGDPNYVLFTRAIQTIQSLLNSVMGRKIEMGTFGPASAVDTDLAAIQNPNASLQPWEFEVDFWTNLGDHFSV